MAAAVACSGGSTGTVLSQDPPVTVGPAASASASPTETTGSGGEDEPAGPRWIAWIRELAPAGGGADPPTEHLYRSLSDGDCARTLEQVEDPLEADGLDDRERALYRGAAAACLAAFHGRPDLWEDAGAELDVVRPAADGINCAERPVYELLTALVQAHRDHPSASFERSDPAESGTALCPTLVALEPDTGPASGGYPVVLVGKDLPATLDVHLSGDGDPVVLETSSDGTRASITMPPGDEGEVVSVWVEGSTFAPIGDLVREFTYTSQNGTEDPTPTPTPEEPEEPDEPDESPTPWTAPSEEPSPPSAPTTR